MKDPRFSLPSAIKTDSETLVCKVYDNDGNEYHAIVEMDVNDFEVTVISVYCSTDKELNNAQDDIRDAIRNEGHKNQVINFENN